MIGADEPLGAARVTGHQRGAAMGAAVEQPLNFALLGAHDEDLALAHLAADEIAGRGDLAVMGEKHP